MFLTWLRDLSLVLNVLVMSKPAMIVHGYTFLDSFQIFERYLGITLMSCKA